jgi:hypothetical protein
MWLSGGLKPDFKTIARFRKDNKEVLIKLLKESVSMSVRMNMVEGNCLFIDGSKIRGNCGIGRCRSRQEIAMQIKQAQMDIEEMAKRVEKDDEQDSQGKSLVFIEGIKSKEDLKNKLEDVMKQMKEEDLQEINMTDPQSIKFISRGGGHSGYNAQVVTDEKAGLIVSAQVVRKNNDIGQIQKQTIAAEANLGKKSKIVCADSGYHNRTEIKKLMDGKREVIVPSQKEVNKERTGKDNEFDKSKFKYDKDKDVYICPQAKELERIDETQDGKIIYQEKKKECIKCKKFGECSINKRGRKIQRMKEDKELKATEVLYKSEKGQKIYKKRQTICERVFGHIKRNLGVNSFLLRGEKGANAELSMIAVCHNVRRWVTICESVNFTQVMGT